MVWPTLSPRFCAWIIGCFWSLPKKLDDAAMIDRAFHLQVLSKIFLPVAMLVITAATIFAVTACWGHFFYPQPRLRLPFGNARRRTPGTRQYSCRSVHGRVGRGPIGRSGSDHCLRMVLPCGPDFQFDTHPPERHRK